VNILDIHSLSVNLMEPWTSWILAIVLFPCMPQISWPLWKVLNKDKVHKHADTNFPRKQFCTPLTPVFLERFIYQVSGYRCYFQVFPPSFKRKNWTRWDVGFQDWVLKKNYFSKDTLFLIWFFTNTIYKGKKHFRTVPSK
jgi:hypothetical protein